MEMGDRSRNRDGLDQAPSKAQQRVATELEWRGAVVAGSCWLLTSSRWSAGWGWLVVVGGGVDVGRRK